MICVFLKAPIYIILLPKEKTLINISWLTATDSIHEKVTSDNLERHLDQRFYPKALTILWVGAKRVSEMLIIDVLC